MDRFPNHPQALQLLPLVARLANNQTLARTYFEKAVTQFPQYALTQAQYGLFLVSIGNLDDGIARFNQAIAQDPKLPAGYAGLAHAYAKKGDIAKAREAADKARELGFTGRLPLRSIEAVLVVEEFVTAARTIVSPLVVHIVRRLAVGGMENGLVNLINHMPGNRYRHAIVCLTEATDFKDRIDNKAIPVIELEQTNGHDPRIHLRVWKHVASAWR